MAILNKLNLRLSFMIMNFYAVKKSKKLKKFSPHAKLLSISLYKKYIYKFKMPACQIFIKNYEMQI